jgi:methionyl-tRNA formyltransferase
MRVIIYCNNENHPCIPKLKELANELNDSINHCELITTTISDKAGDLCFLVSCSVLIEQKTINQFSKVFVLHCSELPKGRGWSPYSWEVLNGSNCLTLSLIEAMEKVDTGDIWLQEKIQLDGTELLVDILGKIIESEIRLIKKCVVRFDEIVPRKQENCGATYYRKRSPVDSKLDEKKTILEQFNLLRIVDNERFPAFFEINGVKYYLRITKER